VHAEDLLVDQGGNREAVKDITEDTPESDGIPALALVVEAVYTIYLSALVVSSQ